MWNFFDGGGVAENDGLAARKTLHVVPNESSEPVAEHAPEFNERVSDESGERVGLQRKDVQSYNEPGSKPSQFWIGDTGKGLRENDAAYSTKGYYAAKESAGTAGHDTMDIVIGIEPTRRTGADLGGITMISNERSYEPVQIVGDIPVNNGTNIAAQNKADPFASKTSSALDGLF